MVRFFKVRPQFDQTGFIYSRLHPQGAFIIGIAICGYAAEVAI
jgi:hypothetical protein